METLIFQRHLKRKHGIPSQCVGFSGPVWRRFLKKITQNVRKKEDLSYNEGELEVGCPSQPMEKNSSI